MALPKLATGLFSRKSGKQDMLGFDLDEDHLKLVHVRVTKLKREVANLLSHEARGMSDEDLSVFVRQTLTSFQLKTPRAFITVPLHLVITRSIEIPSRDPEEIREIVNLQASRHTPYSRSEIIIDLLDLGVVRESYTKVLLIIIPKEIVTRQMKILESAGLKVEKIFFPPEGICHAFSKILSHNDAEQAVGIVHMDSGFTTFIIIRQNKILFVRGISVGANHLLDEREIYRDRFMEELQKSLDSYTGDEIGPPPKTLYLTGVVGEVTDLDELFTETLHIPIRHQTYFNYFSISNPAKQIAASSKRASFFNLIAPLLLFDKMRANLITDEKKLSAHLEQRGRQILKSGALAMLVLTLLFATFLIKIYFKNAYLERLTARYKPVMDEARDIEQVYEKTEVVKEYLAGRGHSLETLVGLYDTIPDDVRLTSIKYENENQFAVKGTSSTMASVFTFVTQLEKSKKFISVKTKYVTNRNEGGSDVADFEIACALAEKAELL